MIHRIRIQNFKSLVDVTVDLDPVTVLIGKSGTGKSNFIRAVRYLRDCLNVHSLGSDIKGFLSPIQHIHTKNPNVSFTVNFTVPDSDFEYSYHLSGNPTTQIVTEESLSISGKIVFQHGSGMWKVKPSVRNLPNPIGILLGRILGLNESNTAYIALRSNLGCYDFSSDVLTLEDATSDPSDGGLADGAENFIRVADRIQSDLSKAKFWRRIASALKSINSAVTSLFISDGTRINVNYLWNDLAWSLELRSESEGFRRFLAHLLAMYQSRSKLTLLFEHPEAGLHPGALESLAWELKRCAEEGRGQVVLTTHSPQLLDHFDVDSLRVVEIHNSETKIGPVSPEQIESVKDGLLKPGELLTVDPARLTEVLAEVTA